MELCQLTPAVQVALVASVTLVALAVLAITGMVAYAVFIKD